MARGSDRVVISGIGAVSPFGSGRDRFWSAISSGESGVREITAFDVSRYACRVAAPVPDSDDDLSAEPGGVNRGAVVVARVGNAAAVVVAQLLRPGVSGDAGITHT